MTATTPHAPSVKQLRSPKGRLTFLRPTAGFAAAAVVLFAVAPLALSDFRLGLLAKYLCTAMVAVGICLAWGRGGLLTLGQGCSSGWAAMPWRCI